MYYLIKWKNDETDGFHDLIDAEILNMQQPKNGLTHRLIRGREVLIARSDIVPQNGALEFRYGGKNRLANEKQGILPGDLRIDPAKFRTATSLKWRDEGKNWEDFPIEIIPLDADEGERRKSRSSHLSRNSLLSRWKRAEALLNGQLSCEACGFDGHKAYGTAIQRCFEVHHKHPLKIGKRKTTLDDLVLLCANCHRAIHGLGDMQFNEFASLFRK